MICFINNLSKFFVILLILMGWTGFANAQGNSEKASQTLASVEETELTILIALGVLLFATIVGLIAVLYALYALKLVFGIEKEKNASEPVEEKVSVSLWERINRRFGAGELVPVSQEEEIMMDHTYDGISELNNHMPPWLKYLFYTTIVSAAVYMSVYLVLESGKSQLEEYQEELAEAAAQAEEQHAVASNSIDETNVAITTDAAALEEAKGLFARNCAACHGSDGGGSVGPNLTDEYWLHGGSVGDIFKVIKYGVQEKGMIAWQQQLKPEEIQNVASYILTLQGSTPENPKEPQGEKYVSEEPKPALEQDAMSSL